MASKLDQGERAAEALLWIAQWGRLRPQELGILQYGRDNHGRKYAEAHCRKLKEMGLVIARKLPGGIKNGTAYVLSEAGARALARAHGAGFKSGKDWGVVENGVWRPPACWKHDLRAYGVLAHLSAMGYEVLPERVIRGDEPRSEKHPDGLIINREHGFSLWLEVEGSRKSGKDHMKPLAITLVKAARGNPTQVYDFLHDCPIKGAAIAIDPEAKDEKGHKIDHWHRIESAIKARNLTAPVPISVIWVKHAGVGVAGIRTENRVIQPQQ